MKIPHSVREIIRIALEEDIGNGDITTAFLIPEDSESRALIIAKGNFVVAGIPFIKEVFSFFDREVRFNVFINDGSKVMKGDVIAEVSGRTKGSAIGRKGQSKYTSAPFRNSNAYKYVCGKNKRGCMQRLWIRGRQRRVSGSWKSML